MHDSALLPPPLSLPVPPPRQKPIRLESQGGILLVAFHFTPEPLPGALRPSRFFRYLPDFGYEPEVITAAVQTKSHPRIHSIPAPTYIPDKYTLGGAVEILLHKIAWPTEMALLWAASASARANRLMKEKRIEAVISTGPPLNTHLTALALKLRYGIPWIADFRDPMLDNPFRQNLGAIPTLADTIVERQIFQHADAILGVSEVIANWWRVRYPRCSHKLRVLYNGYDPQEKLASRPIPRRPYRVLSYVGNVYGLRRPDIILNAIARLAAMKCLSRENFRLAFVGEIDHDVAAANRSVLAELRSSGILESTGMLPRSEALRRMAESDSLLMLDIQDGARGYAVPCKIFEYIRMGRPILTFTQPDSPVQRIITRSGIRHVFIYPGDSEDEVCQKILQFMELPADPVSPSDWFLTKFDGREQTRTLASILTSLKTP